MRLGYVSAICVLASVVGCNPFFVKMDDSRKPLTLEAGVDYYALKWRFERKSLSIEGRPLVVIRVEQHDLAGKVFAFVVDPAMRTDATSRPFGGWGDYEAPNGVFPKGGGPFLYDGRTLQVRIVVINDPKGEAQRFVQESVIPTIADAADIAKIVGLPGDGAAVPLKLLSENASRIIDRFLQEDVLADGSYTIINAHQATPLLIMHKESKEPVGALYVERQPSESSFPRRLSHLAESIQKVNDAAEGDQTALARSLATVARLETAPTRMSVHDSVAAILYIKNRLNATKSKQAFLEALGLASVAFPIKATGCKLRTLLIEEKDTKTPLHATALPFAVDSTSFDTLVRTDTKARFHVTTEPLEGAAKVAVSITDTNGTTKSMTEVGPNRWVLETAIAPGGVFSAK